jgi:hypothetical protein
MFYYDPFIYVPAHSTATAAMSCAIPSDATLVAASMHAHRRLSANKAFVDPAAQPAADPFYVSQDWNSPYNWRGSLALPQGSVIRLNCDYDNSSGDAEFFQGRSIDTDEMCIFMGMYYPEFDSSGFEVCSNGPANYGDGKMSCGSLTSCLASCNSKGVPPPSTDAVVDIDHCWQKCFGSGCDGAYAALLPESACFTILCPQCIKADPSTDPSCRQCANTRCPQQLNACLAQTCP